MTFDKPEDAIVASLSISTDPFDPDDELFEPSTELRVLMSDGGKFGLTTHLNRGIWPSTIADELIKLGERIKRHYQPEFNEDKPVEYCTWVHNPADDRYDTECGLQMYGTKELFTFCPYCERRIKEGK